VLKSVAVMTATLAIAGSSIAYAQQRFGGLGDENDGGRRFEQNYRPSIDDIKAFTDARIAALKAGLQLTPEQEKNWAPFEQALRDLLSCTCSASRGTASSNRPIRSLGCSFGQKPCRSSVPR
jgi:zinc resistance-associated protein